MRLSLNLPEDLDQTAKGNFFEDFVAEMLRPMRLEVTKRVRFTGMEIDLLCKDQDQPRVVFVECKAHRDPLPADVIAKLIGNSSIRGADSAWLFSTSDFTKDGLGQFEEIRSNRDLAQRFAWFPPQRICQLLIQQKRVQDPKTLESQLSGCEVGDWTLIVGPLRWLWVVELIEAGLPASFTTFDHYCPVKLEAALEPLQTKG